MARGIEIEVVPPQARELKDCQQTSEARKGKKAFLPKFLQREQSCDTLILNLQPPELQDNTFLLFEVTQFVECSVQLLSRVRLFATPWTAALQASLSITHSQNLLKLICIESVMPSNHLILCHPLFLLKNGQ